MLATALEQVAHLKTQRPDNRLVLTVGEALEQHVALGIRADAQTRVPVAAPLAVAWDGTARLVAVAFLAQVLQAIQDAIQGGHGSNLCAPPGKISKTTRSESSGLSLEFSLDPARTFWNASRCAGSPRL